MQKVQVKFDVSPLSLLGPLGNPILCVFRGLESNAQTYVLAEEGLASFSEIRRIVVPLGHMTAHDADVLALALGDAMYHYCVRHVGLQGVLPTSVD